MNLSITKQKERRKIKSSEERGAKDIRRSLARNESKEINGKMNKKSTNEELIAPINAE